MATLALDIELVDKVEDDLAREIMEFWRRQGINFGEQEARERLQSLIALGRDAEGQLQATATAPVVRISQLNDNLMYQYRNLVAPEFADADAGVAEAIICKFFHQANERCQASPGGPVGVYAEVPRNMIPPGPMPAVFMADNVPMYLCGMSPGGPVKRVAWFDNVRISPEHSGEVVARERVLPDGFTLELPRNEVSAELGEEIRAFWAAETSLPEQAMTQRLPQVYMVVRDPDDALCGVTTSFVHKAPLVSQPMHFFRVFVAESRRELDLAVTMVRELRDDLMARYEAGEIKDSVGIFTLVENPLVAKFRNEAIWASTRFVFVGMSEKGLQCRVIYYPGASVFDLA